MRRVGCINGDQISQKVIRVPLPPRLPVSSSHTMATAAGAVVANDSSGSANTRDELMQETYTKLKEEMLKDPALEFEFADKLIQWLDHMVDYNVLGGKCNRVLSVVDSYCILKGVDVLGKEETFLACTLGWCLEWLHASYLVLDDIMDNSQTRRGKPCWFRVPQVGLIAINNGILLHNYASRILQRHFKGKPYFDDLIDLFNEAKCKATSGQLLDLIITHEGKKDLTKYNLTIYFRIVQQKAAYYSFYLPVACALLLAGESLDNFSELKNILIEMGSYFQIQDDYLDCFGDSELTGKIGTDIEEYKCSWLVVQALERANENQKCILFENYGKSHPACVAKVKNLYKNLNLEEVFRLYERKSYDKLISDIHAQPNKDVRNVLISFLHRIYKRNK